MRKKVAAVYQWVTANTYYDWDGLNSGNLAPVDPYSVLTNHYAVCEGFATLLAELLNSVGIPCVTFHGASCSANPGATRDDDSVWTEAEYNEVDHAWNAAYVNGEWRYYDPTWDTRNSYHQGSFLPGLTSRDYYAVAADDFAAGHRSAYRINDTGGFRLENGTWIRYDENGQRTNGIVLDYYDRSVYVYEDGFPVTGRERWWIISLRIFRVPGNICRPDMIIQVGFCRTDIGTTFLKELPAIIGHTLNGVWYYLDPQSCQMVTGWRWIDGKWVLFFRFRRYGNRLEIGKWKMVLHGVFRGDAYRMDLAGWQMVLFRWFRGYADRMGLDRRKMVLSL